MALRISQATGTTAESWLGMQTAYDLWQVRRAAKRLKVKKLVAA
jgi:addiction module HigA family antidote